MSLTRRGRIIVFLAIVGTFLGAIVVAGLIFLHSLGLFGGSSPGNLVSITIPRGASVSEVGDILAARNVVPSSLGFRVAVRLDHDSSIEAGRYKLHEGLSARDALSALGRGPDIKFVTVTFPEGSTLKDFARVLAARTKISRRDFLALAKSGKVRSRYEPARVDFLEGLLFPSTYQVAEDDNAKVVLKRLVDTFNAAMRKLDLSSLKKLGVTPYQAVIVASMVEAEAKLDADRGKIARVIYNRLDQGMPLGIDATILYALGHHTSELTQSDLAIDSPYNTRLHTGLPPTPIGAPGLASLRAAVNPAGGSWLYYVLADCSGHHAFSTDYNHFLADKAHYESLSC